jgi:lipoprotein-anchoring transpeptidase ErfK/SrfK
MRALFLILDRRGPLALALALCAACGGGDSEAAETVRPDDARFVRPEGLLQATKEAPTAANVPPRDPGADSPAVQTPAEARSSGAGAPAPAAGLPVGGVETALGDAKPESAAPARSPEAPGAADRASEAAARERGALALLEEGQPAAAARAVSDLLAWGVTAEPPADRATLSRWTEMLRRSQAQHRWNRKGAWPALEVEVRPGDSLIAIRKRVLQANPELLLCTGLVARANQLPNERAIRPGDVLRVPTDRASVLVDLGARWALYRLGDEVATAWEVGIGKEGSETPPGTYAIGVKQMNPAWLPEGREPVAFGDPDNPLGTRWLAWYQDGRNTHLGFHGTGQGGIGERVSEGCIRMLNPDVELLFEILPEGAEVVVQP